MAFVPQADTVPGTLQHLLRQVPGPPDPAALVEGQIAVGDTANGGDEALYYAVGHDPVTGKATGVVTIQSGTGSGGGGPAYGYLENLDNVALWPGCPVQPDPSGTGVERWDGTRQFLGLVATTTAPQHAAPVQDSGPLQLSDWTQATGQSSLLAGAYFADPAHPGKLTSSRPASGTLQKVGVATASALMVSPGPRIKQ